MKNYKDTENKILGSLLRQPLESKSIHKISLDTKLSYVTVHKLIPNLVKRRLVKQEKKGKACLISIDFEHARLEELSSAILSEKAGFLKKYPQIAVLTKEIEEALTGEFYILLLFGSYAKENAGKESDIDLLFIIPYRKDIDMSEIQSLKNRKAIFEKPETQSVSQLISEHAQKPSVFDIYKEKINKALRLYPEVKKDFNIVSTDDFMDMLNEKYTVGRSVFQHGIVLFGTEHYYSMVKKYVRTKGY